MPVVYKRYRHQLPMKHDFMLWDEAGESGEKPRMHENKQTPHRKTHKNQELLTEGGQ